MLLYGSQYGWFFSGYGGQGGYGSQGGGGGGYGGGGYGGKFRSLLTVFFLNIWTVEFQLNNTVHT